MKKLIVYSKANVIMADIQICDDNSIAVDLLKAHKPCTSDGLNMTKRAQIREWNSYSRLENDTYLGIDMRSDNLVDRVEDYLGRTTLDRFFNCRGEFNNIPLGRAEVSESLDVIKQLQFFNNIVVPEKTIEFLTPYIESIKGLELSPAKLKSLYDNYTNDVVEATEYVLYVGTNEKYKYKLGKVSEERISINNGVEEIEYKASYELLGETRNFWANEKNLLWISI